MQVRSQMLWQDKENDDKVIMSAKGMRDFVALITTGHETLKAAMHDLDR